MCENFLVSLHQKDILHMLNDPDKDKYFSININFLELFEFDTNLGNALLTDPESSIKLWNEAVFNVQNNLLKEIDKNCTLKNNVNCRIFSLPPWPHVCRTIFRGNDDADKFLQVTGTVIRMSARKLLEYQRQYICTKCKYPITVEAKFDRKNMIKQPRICTNPEGCPGKNIITFGELDPYNCKDYQELEIQEDLSKMSVGTLPCQMIVVLEDDLVNMCKPGENVTITGIVKKRWYEFVKGSKIIIDIVLRANHVQVNNSRGLSVEVSDDMRKYFDTFWTKYKHEPIVGRNIILKSISPEIYGRELVKLAVAIVLAGGSQKEDSQISTGIDTRSESHLLLIGDPGTGKSQMLKFASKIIPRSVLTTGVGSTAAGLTVTAVMDDGEWQLEAGALVLADGGICCIDEFNSMKEHDRTSIHEAMEQQTISVAKAGMICKLKTRCTILAACNPKGNIDPSQPLCVNVAMSSPLLSRFDLILLLRDVVNEEDDRKLAEYLLQASCELTGEGVHWSVEKLQAYYAIIKKECPKLTSDAETILSTYYQLQRKFGSRNKSRTTVRLLESLIRLSQGHAKLIYHKEVEVIDTIFAIILVDAALDQESSLLNLNIDYHVFFDNPEQMYWDLLEIILGKLNLDYIYQREIEKVNRDHSETTDEKSFNRENTVTQNAITSVPKRNLFSYRNPGHIQQNDLSTQNQKDTSNSSSSEPPRVLFTYKRQLSSENGESEKKTKTEHVEDKREKDACQEVKKRNLNSPLKTDKVESKKNSNLNEIELLKMLPSVNDDFMKFEMNIDWDMEEQFSQDQIVESEKIIEKNEKEIDNPSCSKEHVMNIKESDKQLSRQINEIQKNMNIDTKKENNLGYCGEKIISSLIANTDVNKNKGNDIDKNKHDCKKKRSNENSKKHVWGKIVADFELVPRETRDQENNGRLNEKKQVTKNFENNLKNEKVVEQTTAKYQKSSQDSEEAELNYQKMIADFDFDEEYRRLGFDIDPFTKS